MNRETMTACADLIFTDAVQDLAKKTGMSISEVRSAAMESPAYSVLYDFETGLWKEGPDAFAELVDLGQQD